LRGLEMVLCVLPDYRCSTIPAGTLPTK
jgi:hypothetical protein